MFNRVNADFLDTIKKGDKVTLYYHSKDRAGTIEKIDDSGRYIVVAQTMPEVGYRTFRVAEISNLVKIS